MLSHGGKHCCSCEDEEQLEVQKQTFLVRRDEACHTKEEWHALGRGVMFS